MADTNVDNSDLLQGLNVLVKLLPQPGDAETNPLSFAILAAKLKGILVCFIVLYFSALILLNRTCILHLAPRTTNSALAWMLFVSISKLLFAPSPSWPTSKPSKPL